jgi:hypothetical protein
VCDVVIVSFVIDVCLCVRRYTGYVLIFVSFV